MISIEFAEEQIERLGGMYRFPEKYPAAVQDLAKALAHYPETTEEMAVAVIDAIKETATSETPCPMPAEIRSMVSARLEESRPDPDCNLCRGVGFPDVIRNGEVVGVGPQCGCWTRRPAPSYPRRGDQPAGDMAEKVREVAEAKRS